MRRGARIKMTREQKWFKYEGPLSDNQVAWAMHLCFLNAKDLLEESKLLRRNRKYARAFALAVLALEELGRIPIFLSSLTISKKDRKKWKEFWQALLYSHVKKQRVWVGYGALIAKTSRHPHAKIYKERLPKNYPALINEFKKACFYVSTFKKDLILPNKFGKENMEWTSWMIHFTEKRIKTFEELHSTITRSRKMVTAVRRALIEIGRKAPSSS